MFKVVIAVASLMALAGAAPVRAQIDAGKRDAYEVVSIKPRTSGTCETSGGGVLSAGRLYILCMPVMRLISDAYDVGCTLDCDKYVSGAPAWVFTQRFDFQAKPEHPDQVTDVRVLQNIGRPRMRALLEDRFKLRARQESKIMPAYLLTVSKGGFKAKEEKTSDRPGYMAGPGFVTGNAMTITKLAHVISVFLDRPVVDGTGLSGEFHIELMYDPAGNGRPQTVSKMDAKSGMIVPAGPDEPERPSIFSALQEQLGLKLEAAKAPVPVLVIEQVELPSEN
jgi:bla regulator protein blaR1